MTKTNPQVEKRKKKPSLFTRVRGNFLAGLIIIAPIGLTMWLIWSVVGWIDGWVWPWVPARFHPDVLINSFLGYKGEEQVFINVRGLGVIVFLIFTVIVGILGKGLLGRSMLRWGERLVDRMPIIRSIYNGVKQIAETVFSRQDTSFDRACLIEYPRKGLWAVAFISTRAKGEIAKKLASSDVDNDMITVFLPTTPNPTSGFLLFVKNSDVKELDMSVEDAAKLVISAGLVYPTLDRVESQLDKG